MGKDIIMFGDTETEKHKFQRYKNQIFVEDFVEDQTKFLLAEKKYK